MEKISDTSMIHINNYREENKPSGDGRRTLIWGLLPAPVYF